MSETKMRSEGDTDDERKVSWKRIEAIEEKLKQNEEKLKLLDELLNDPK